eukprot:6173658-Pleurochrysis_carterae.AAC.3
MTLLQVRHPLHTIASQIAAFCDGLDTASAAAASTQLRALNALMPPPQHEPSVDRRASALARAHDKGFLSASLHSHPLQLCSARLRRMHITPARLPLP